MAKLNLKPGEKLDMAIRGSTEELCLKTSFAKETGDMVYLAPPIVDGKAYLPEPNSPVILSWGGGGSEFFLEGVFTGNLKQGIRTYLSIRCDGPVQRRDRRAFKRIPAELEGEICTAPESTRERRISPCRTSDISSGGVAVYTNAAMEVGETVEITLCHKADRRLTMRAVVCWVRPAPKLEGFAFSSGLQLTAASADESVEFAKLVAAIAAKA